MTAGKRATTLLEAMVTIFIVGVAGTAVFGGMYASAAARRAAEFSDVTRFLHGALDGAKRKADSGLADSTSTDIVNVTYNVGRQRVETRNVLTGSKSLEFEPAERPLQNGLTNVALAGRTGYGDIDLEAWLRVDPSSPAGWSAGLTFGHLDPGNHYRLAMDRTSLKLIKVQDGQETVLNETSTVFTEGTWYRLRVTTVGPAVTAYLDGLLRFSAADPAMTPAYAGFFGSGSARFSVDEARLIDADGDRTFGFEQTPVEPFTETLIAAAPYHLDGFESSITVAPYQGQPDLKHVTTTAAWRSEGVPRSLTLETLLDAR